MAALGGVTRGWQLRRTHAHVVGDLRWFEGLMTKQLGPLVGALCESVGLTETPRALGESEMARSDAAVALVEAARNV